jgi:uncharacterized OsmC-like protein
METARISWVGRLRTNTVHLKSGAEIITDAPTDNHDNGDAFSPTDLLASALGSYICPTMDIKETFASLLSNNRKAKSLHRKHAG